MDMQLLRPNTIGLTTKNEHAPSLNMPTYFFFDKKTSFLTWFERTMMSKLQKLTFLGELSLQSVLLKENKTKTQF